MSRKNARCGRNWQRASSAAVPPAGSDGLAGYFDAGREEQRGFYEQRLEKLAVAQEADKKVRQASQQLSGIQEAIHQLELARAKLEMSSEETQQAILKAFGLTPERAAQEAYDWEPARCASP